MVAVVAAQVNPAVLPPDLLEAVYLARPFRGRVGIGRPEMDVTQVAQFDHRNPPALARRRPVEGHPARRTGPQ